MVDANKPKAFSIIIGQKKIEKNAADVVNDVNIIALKARLNVYDILACKFEAYMISGAIISLYLQASMNIKMSSAAIPITTKMMHICNCPKYVH